MKRLPIFLFGIVCTVFLPFMAIAATMPAGLPSDLLWFSKDPFTVGDHLTISTVVFNSTEYQFTGTLELNDGTTTIGTKTFSVGAGGGAEIISFPWVATGGAHSFSVAITENELAGAGGQVNATLLTKKTFNIKRLAKNLPVVRVVETATTSPEVAQAAEGKIAGKISGIEEAIQQKIPAPVTEVATPIVGAIEDFRKEQAINTATRIASTLREIALNEATSTVSTESVVLGVATTSPKKKNTQVATTTATSTREAPSNISGGWSTVGGGILHGGVIKSPFQYLALLFFLVVNFFTTNAYAFYIFFAVLIFWFIRWVIRFFFIK